MALQREDVASVFHRYGNYLGRGLATLLTLYGPDLTILSGSAAHYYPLFRPGLEEALCRADAYATNNWIVPSELGGCGRSSRRDNDSRINLVVITINDGVTIWSIPK